MEKISQVCNIFSHFSVHHSPGKRAAVSIYFSISEVLF